VEVGGEAPEVSCYPTFREVLRDDRIHNLIFDARRLRTDSRKITFSYKVQFQLRRLVNDL
jgi:hypothetical protein